MYASWILLICKLASLTVFVLYLESKEVFLILMFADFGVKLKLRYCLLKYILPLYFNILCFKFLYLQMMEAWIAVTILMEFSLLCCDIPVLLKVLPSNIDENLWAWKLIIFNLHTYLYIYVCIFIPHDGLWERLKHVALLIQTVKSCIDQGQYI